MRPKLHPMPMLTPFQIDAADRKVLALGAARNLGRKEAGVDLLATMPGRSDSENLRLHSVLAWIGSCHR